MATVRNITVIIILPRRFVGHKRFMSLLYTDACYLPSLYWYIAMRIDGVAISGNVSASPGIPYICPFEYSHTVSNIRMAIELALIIPWCRYHVCRSGLGR